MGTRNLTCVMIDNEYKIAQYGQWDGYPGGQGVTILNFLLTADLAKAKEIFSKVRFITEEEWNEIIAKHTNEGSISMGSEHEAYWSEHLAHLSRDLGGEILKWLYDGLADVVKDGIDFAHDSLFCEYAYVIDFDANTFEVYEGFNKEELKPIDRFYGPEKEDHKEYKSVKCIKVYLLDDLPTEEEFLKYFEDLYAEEEE